MIYVFGLVKVEYQSYSFTAADFQFFSKCRYNTVHTISNSFLQSIPVVIMLAQCKYRQANISWMPLQSLCRFSFKNLWWFNPLTDAKGWAKQKNCLALPLQNPQSECTLNVFFVNFGNTAFHWSVVVANYFNIIHVLELPFYHVNLVLTLCLNLKNLKSTCQNIISL